MSTQELNGKKDYDAFEAVAMGVLNEHTPAKKHLSVQTMGTSCLKPCVKKTCIE